MMNEGFGNFFGAHGGYCRGEIVVSLLCFVLGGLLGLAWIKAMKKGAGARGAPETGRRNQTKNEKYSCGRRHDSLKIVCAL
jgi:hypothetical protein